MKEYIITTISRISKIKQSLIKEKTTFEYISFNMIDFAELIMTVEDKFNIVADDDIYYSNTVGELIKQFKDINNRGIVLTNQLNKKWKISQSKLDRHRNYVFSKEMYTKPLKIQ